MPAESLRALSVRLPWAALIAHGYKSIEVRSWPTDVRGALAICSSRRWDESEAATYQWAKYYPMSEGETGCDRMRGLPRRSGGRPPLDEQRRQSSVRCQV
jgi:hypothetical protein